MALEGRAAEMARSLASAAKGVGLPPGEVATLDRAHLLAMEPRVAQIEDDHHPAYLHPGRSALILMHDVGKVDVTVLVLATLHESRDMGLRVPSGQVESEVGAAAVEALRAIPIAGDERLVEHLVTLGPGSALVALAERLDHLRHLHMREDLMHLWADVHDEVVQAWLPFAARTNSTLARRYAHWVRTFVKRI